MRPRAKPAPVPPCSPSRARGGRLHESAKYEARARHAGRLEGGGPFRVGKPADTTPKGPWWRRFGDPSSTRSKRGALANSPTLAIASARLNAGARAAFQRLCRPVSADRRRRARRAHAHLPESPATNNNAPNFSTTQTDMVYALTVNYEVDLAGRVNSRWKPRRRRPNSPLPISRTCAWC